MKRLLLLTCAIALTCGAVACQTNNPPTGDSHGGAGNWGAKNGPVQGSATGSLGAAEGSGGGGGDLGNHTSR